MSKPVIHVILPPMAPDSTNAHVVARSLESFTRQMYPFDVVVHESDHDYEVKKNPSFGREAAAYVDSSAGAQG